MGAVLDADIMQNGLEQLQEMIRARPQPSFACGLGLCNENLRPESCGLSIRQAHAGGSETTRPGPALLVRFKLVGKEPGARRGRLMDFIETNEYFGSWAEGPPEAVAKHLDDLPRCVSGQADCDFRV